MPHSHAANDAARSRWPIVVLVVGSVSAASLALGLLVVGPMIQRRMETPPPALSVSGTSTVTPTRISAGAADVEIKERIVRRPAPKPALPKPTDPFGGPDQTLSIDLPPSGIADTRTAAPNAKPSIQATVSDASGSAGTAPSGSVLTPGRETRDAGHTRRRPADRSMTDSGSGDLGPGAQPQAATSAPSKARAHRASPLDALPFLDPTGPAPGDAKSATAASPESAPDPRKTGKRYHVQVGRFADAKEAEQLRDELANSGLSPRVVRAQKGGTTEYRVQVGTYGQKENADRQIDQLKSRSYDPYLAEEDGMTSEGKTQK